MASSSLGVGNPSTVFLSLLPPLKSGRRLALLVVLLSLVVFVCLVPFAREPMMPLPGFIPTYQSALFISDLLTAAVLFGQFFIQRTRALLTLATAYLFTAVAIVPHTLSFPGLFSPDGLMGSGSQTTVWLYMLWHVGFPLLMIVHAFVKQDTSEIASPAVAALTASGAALATVVGFTLLATSGHGILPTLLRPDNSYTAAMEAVILGVWGLSILALVVVWLRRPHTALDLWIVVVMVAWVCDVGLSAALNAKRFDLGFYAGRIYGLVAASFVLIMLLLETRALYVRLARNLDVRRADAESRAAVAQRHSAESAETLRAVVDVSSLAVVAVSPSGDVLLWNKTAERLFGYSSDELLGVPCPLMTLDPNAGNEQATLFAGALAGASVRDVDFVCRRKNGERVAMRGSAAPFYDASKALRGVAFALEDLSEKNKTEAMLRQSQKMEAVGQLTGGVAHDFNNILMVIQANVEELLEDQALPEGHRAMLEAIQTSGQRAAELTRRLLAFSRKQRLQPLPTDLSDLVVGVDKLLRRALGEQVEIEAILAEDLWTTSVDRSQVEAALVNLAVNARDAMPGGGKLLIETANAELDSDYARANAGVMPGQYVMLAVSDTGTGIDPENLARVFEPFFTTKGVGKGTGLGLSMVYGFIKQSNGHLKIYSEVGCGTTIRMYLPRTTEASVPAVAQAAPVMPRGSERILVVEDDAQVRTAVLAQLTSLGYAVAAVPTPAEALARLTRGETFDLMLTDVIMPGMDGPTLAKAAKARSPSMRIMFMSGYSENAVFNHGILESNERLLSKPFRKLDLANQLREAIASR